MAVFVPDKKLSQFKGGGVFVPDQPAKKKDDGGGGGLLGTLKRIPGAFASDIYEAAVGIPAGLVYLGQAFGEDIAHDVGLRDGHRPRNLARIGKAIGEGTVEDFRHPLRHPGNTFLDLLGIASLGAGTAARVGAAGKAARTGAGARGITKALATKPQPGVRKFRVGDLEVEHPESRSALTRGITRAADKRRQRRAELHPTGRAARAEARKAGRALTETLRAEEAQAKAPAAALAAIGRKLKPSEQYALRVVAEEAPVNGRIAAHAKALRDPAVRGAERRRHQKRIKLLEQTKLHIVDADAKPAFKPEATKLRKVYSKMEELAGGREALAKELGLLTDEQAGLRKTYAGRAALGATHERPLEAIPDERIIPGMFVRPLDRENIGRVVDVDPQARTATVFFHNRQTGGRATKEFGYDDLALEGKGRFVGAEDFEATPGSVYVPDIEQRTGASGAIRSLGGQRTIGEPRSPIRQGYTGANKRQARDPLNTTQAVAEASLAMSRYSRLVKLRDKMKLAATPEPRFKDDVAVRLDKLGSNEALPKDARQFLDNPDELAMLDETEQARLFEQVRSSMIFGDDTTIRSMSPEQLAEFRRLEGRGLVGWVPKRLLGDLAKPHAPLQAVAGKVPTAIIDGINDAQRLAVLYLKPAYAAPNIMGNAFLNLVQQGFAAPKNLARAAAMQWRLGPDMTARIDTMMHEGFAAAIRGEGRGPLSAATQKAASIWGAGVDRPFRRAAFLHEAGRAGFKSADELERLLTDPDLHDTLINVTKRGNREIIDYGRLSSREREIVRRVIFFYPWVKGSTLYAGHLVTQAPGTTAVLGNIGAYGEDRASEELGPHPSYLKGAFLADGKLVNPAAASVLGTPGQVGSVAAALLTGRTPEVAELGELISPPAAFAANLLAGENLQTGRRYPRTGRGILDVGKDTLIGSLPQTRLVDALRGTSKARLFPPSPRSGLEQYLIGGIVPRRYDPARLRALARREQRELGR